MFSQRRPQELGQFPNKLENVFLFPWFRSLKWGGGPRGSSVQEAGREQLQGAGREQLQGAGREQLQGAGREYFEKYHCVPKIGPPEAQNMFVKKLIQTVPLCS